MQPRERGAVIAIDLEGESGPLVVGAEMNSPSTKRHALRERFIEPSYNKHLAEPKQQRVLSEKKLYYYSNFLRPQDLKTEHTLLYIGSEDLSEQVSESSSNSDAESYRKLPLIQFRPAQPYQN
jgi:hypothetical protein